MEQNEIKAVELEIKSGNADDQGYLPYKEEQLLEENLRLQDHNSGNRELYDIETFYYIFYLIIFESDIYEYIYFNVFFEQFFNIIANQFIFAMHCFKHLR
jgi:hypothetical protein